MEGEDTKEPFDSGEYLVAEIEPARFSLAGLKRWLDSRRERKQILSENGVRPPNIEFDISTAAGIPRIRLDQDMESAKYKEGTL